MVMGLQLVIRSVPKDAIYMLLEMNQDDRINSIIGIFDDCENAIFALDEKRKEAQCNSDVMYIVRRMTKNEYYHPMSHDILSWSAEVGYMFYPQLNMI